MVPNPQLKIRNFTQPTPENPPKNLKKCDNTVKKDFPKKCENFEKKKWIFFLKKCGKSEIWPNPQLKIPNPQLKTRHFTQRTPENQPKNQKNAPIR